MYGGRKGQVVHGEASRRRIAAENTFSAALARRDTLSRRPSYVARGAYWFLVASIGYSAMRFGGAL